MTASAPPQTKPSERREECTRRVEPGVRPRERNSEARDEVVHRGPGGGGVCGIVLRSRFQFGFVRYGKSRG
jgi:hypothetical protein